MNPRLHKESPEKQGQALAALSQRANEVLDTLKKALAHQPADSESVAKVTECLIELLEKEKVSPCDIRVPLQRHQFYNTNKDASLLGEYR